MVTAVTVLELKAKIFSPKIFVVTDFENQFHSRFDSNQTKNFVITTCDSKQVGLKSR